MFKWKDNMTEVEDSGRLPLDQLIDTLAAQVKVLGLHIDLSYKVQRQGGKPMNRPRSLINQPGEAKRKLVARTTRESHAYGELPPIFLMTDWISAAASFQAREISWPLEPTSLSLHLPTILLSISR